MIKVDSELCKGCDICIEVCPKHVYVKSSKENKKGVYLPCPENEKECTKCHLCELMCPDQAITVDDNDNLDNISDAISDSNSNTFKNEDINEDDIGGNGND